MRVYLVNPSDKSFGIGVITPRWLYVLAAATPSGFGDPVIVDETLEQLDATCISAGDIVGIGIHTGNALRGYEIGKLARQHGAFVVFGGVHATLFPNEAHELGGAHAVVKGDGDTVWASVLEDCKNYSLKHVYAAGRIEASAFQSARWDLLPRNRYMWASVQTVRGCPKHCSFCSVWRTDGQRPRIRTADVVVRELQQLRRLGFRFVLLADDNFYPVSLTDLKLASRQGNTQRLDELKAIRAERFELMERLAADVAPDMVFFTQITMEAVEDPAFLDAMSRAKIKGALVGIEAVTPQGLKDIYKDFNAAGEELVNRLRRFPQHGVKVLGLSSLACRVTALKLLKLLFPWHKGPTLPSHSLSCSCLFLGPSILNIGKRRCSTIRRGSPEFLSPGIGLFLVSCGRKSFPLTPQCQLRKFANERSRSGTGFIASERYGGAPIACAHLSLVLPFCLFRNSTGKCTQIRGSRLTVHVLAVPYAGRAGWQSPVACCLPLVRYQLQVICSVLIPVDPFCVRHLRFQGILDDANRLLNLGAG